MKTACSSVLIAALLTLLCVGQAEASSKQERREKALLKAAQSAYEVGDLLKQIPAKYGAEKGLILHAAENAYYHMELLGKEFVSANPADDEVLLTHAQGAVHFAEIAQRHAKELDHRADQEDDDQVEHLAHHMKHEFRRIRNYMRRVVRLLK